jgi:hypothetical protein
MERGFVLGFAVDVLGNVLAVVGALLLLLLLVVVVVVLLLLLLVVLLVVVVLEVRCFLCAAVALDEASSL